MATTHRTPLHNGAKIKTHRHDVEKRRKERTHQNYSERTETGMCSPLFVAGKVDGEREGGRR